MKIIKLLKNPKPYFIIALKRGINLWRTIFYRGEKVICKICDWKGKTFFDGKCPKCNALPRTRLIPFALNYFDLIKDNLKILHVAPNKNEYEYVKRRITTIDNYDRLNIRPVKHINKVEDLTKTKLDSNAYDLVIAWHVLEHIPEDAKAISEMYRILKPKGHCLISVPIYPAGNLKTYEDTHITNEDYERIHGHYDHCRSCGLDYYERFESLGFKTETLYVHKLEKNIQDYYGLKADHVVWCFKK